MDVHVLCTICKGWSLRLSRNCMASNVMKSGEDGDSFVFVDTSVYMQISHQHCRCN